eukprot:jgi/Botrbrau1/17219/Bobra.0799s0002.1
MAMKPECATLAWFLLSCILVSGEVTLQTGGPSDTALQSAAGPAAPGPAVLDVSACASKNESTLLFTQRADTAIIRPLKPGSGSMEVEVTMTNVGRTTTFFSDLPDRLAGRIPTKTFVETWDTNATDWVPNAALVGVGPLGYDRTLILTLTSPPVYNNNSNTLIYNATVILKNTTVLGDPEQSPIVDVTNNIARAMQSFLIDLKATGGQIPTFTMDEPHLFIDTIGGCVGWNGIWIHTGVCGGGGWWGGGVCGGYHGLFVGGYWCA